MYVVLQRVRGVTLCDWGYIVCVGSHCRLGVPQTVCQRDPHAAYVGSQAVCDVGVGPHTADMESDSLCMLLQKLSQKVEWETRPAEWHVSTVDIRLRKLL